MFGRFMNNYYYGKSGKGDYRKEDLPTNRMQLFWEMLRVNSRPVPAKPDDHHRLDSFGGGACQLYQQYLWPAGPDC